MFINAEPRYVSNGFETFVPKHRTALHQRLAAMTNNDLNAWSANAFGPKVPPASGTWDAHVNTFNNENFPVQNLYSGYHQEPLPQGQAIDYSKSISYSNLRQNQYQFVKREPTSQQVYQVAPASMNCLPRSNPMLGHDYSQWSLGQGRGSFAEFSSMQTFPKDLNFQSSVGLGTASFTTGGPSNMLHALSYMEDASIYTTGMDIDKTSPSTVYSSDSTSTNSMDPGALGNFDMMSSQGSTKSSWWPDMHMNHGQHQPQHMGQTYTSHDGLTNYESDQRVLHEQICNPFKASLQNEWSAQSVANGTISPKELSLEFPEAALSLSESSQGSVPAFSEASTPDSSEDDDSDYSGPEILAVEEFERRVQRPRHVLPSSGPTNGLIVPVLPSNDFPNNRTTRRAIKPMPKSSTPDQTSATEVRRGNAPSQRSDIPSMPVVHRRLEPKPTTATKEPSRTRALSPATEKMQHRDAKDEFLVRSKQAGMSYKEIRRKGKFTEAESTLRGRFRTLTKRKADRVRKPEWNDNDIRLLKKAVRKLTPGGDPSRGKVPWKQVAEYIADNGGSYHFGNATCRKRWDDLQADV